MISPMHYRSLIEDYSLDQLRKERDELIEEIKQFENNKNPEDEYLIALSPGVKYQCNNEYLIEVVQLINQRYNQSLWEDDEEEDGNDSD